MEQRETGSANLQFFHLGLALCFSKNDWFIRKFCVITMPCECTMQLQLFIIPDGFLTTGTDN